MAEDVGLAALADAVPAASPLQAARMRLSRNRVAMGALAFLIAVILASLLGPLALPNAGERIHQDYVRVPPSFSAYPKPEGIAPALARVAARMRVSAEGPAVAADALRVTLVSARPIDERLLVFFPRSDVFGPAKVLERADDGRRLMVETPLVHRHFLFGTDSLGRDLLARILAAGQVSLAVGLLATTVALAIGVIYGAVAGYFGGNADLIMMRLVDVLYALPFLFFVILLVVFFGRNFALVFLAIGAVEWLDMARIVRGEAMAIRRREYVLAAEALGVRTAAILRRHVVPNALGPVIVYATLMVPKVILLESFLSFLGLGVQEPATSWGALIAEGARDIQGATWLLIFPSLFLVNTLLALNLLGDGLRDALDPRDGPA